MLLDFVNYLNAAHDTFRFTVNYSPVSVNFLDVIVSCDTDGYLSTDLHVKPTETCGKSRRIHRSDDPEKLWTHFRAQTLKVSESYLQSIPGTFKSFLAKDTRTHRGESQG